MILTNNLSTFNLKKMRKKSLSITTSLKESVLTSKLGNPARSSRQSSININIFLRNSCETPVWGSTNYLLSKARDSKLTLANHGSRKASIGNSNLNENRQFSNVLINEKTEMIEKLPLAPERARKVFSQNLNNYEKIEILKYKEIFYVGQGKKKECNSYDDEQSNLILYQNDHIAYRYQVKKLIGLGSFSQVYEAYDWKKKSSVALKVIRNKKKFKKQSSLEIEFLKTVKEKAANLPFPKILTSFEFREHVCIVFSLLQQESREVLSSFSDFLKFSVDILACLQFLHVSKVVHCDLKPSNIIISSGIAYLIDLGTSTRISEQVYKYIQSRSYRAPEVIFRIKYDEKIDIWSFGCVLFEMIKGKTLFEGNDENEIVDQIIEKIGEPPEKWRIFCVNTNLKKIENFKLCDLIQDIHPVLQDIILRCLKWNPKQRISAEEALRILKKYTESS
jgi:dual specificity tyrosine-phosphorylation-regulated kinase 2/3/4